MVANTTELSREIEIAYKAIRNRLRKYSASSIVNLALQIMWNPPPTALDELRSAPWLTLLIVKWALQDNMVSMNVGASISVEEIDHIRQELWKLQSLPDTENAYLMIRVIGHVQLEFQRKETWGFLRWPALYARMQNNHRSRQQFRTALEMEPNTFLDLAYSLYAAIRKQKMPFNPDWLSPWRAVYGEDVDRIYDILARDLHSLRIELRNEAAQRLQRKHELYEFPYLKRFPLLLLPNGQIHCWHRLVFARGLEELVHLRLSDKFGSEYTESFSKIFEEYVIELAADTGNTHINEACYKALVGHNSPAVEVIFDGDDCNILVEAKMSLFSDDVLLQDSEAVIFNKTKRVRDGIAQGWKVGRLIRQHSAFGTRFLKTQDFLFVVTSRELMIGGGEMLKRLFVPDVFNYPDEHSAKTLPLTNVFILSIEEFENLMGCVKSGEVDLSAVVKEAAMANQNGNTSRIFFSDFLSQHTKKWTLPTVLVQARLNSEARAHAQLPHN